MLKVRSQGVANFPDFPAHEFIFPQTSVLFPLHLFPEILHDVFLVELSLFQELYLQFLILREVRFCLEHLQFFVQ